jgi:hypothetical protein
MDLRKVGTGGRGRLRKEDLISCTILQILLECYNGGRDVQIM